MARKHFPNHIAVYTNYFAFTTLTKSDVASHKRSPYTFPESKTACEIFSLDEHMAYTSFANDHGPLNLAYTFRACIYMNTRIEEAREKNFPVVMYCSPEPTVKSNMALMVALYWLIVEHESPWNAFMPVASMEVMPFRDAGSGHFDWALSAQDVIYGIYKALELRLLDLSDFDAKFYEYYETPSNGDLNILGPFIPFASPVESSWVSETRRIVASPLGAIRTPGPCAPKESLSKGFQCVLRVFREENVGVVVRLNDELYDRRHFTNRGMEHVDLYFDDGNNPSDEIVRAFIRLAEEVIENRGKKVAVHCKAGLGRTGVLIGAYLIYKFQFSAQEVIGYMRIVRPGMIVGPQQHYMVENQMKWVGWAARDQLLRELAENGRGATTPLLTPPSDTGLQISPSRSLTPPASATLSTFAASQSTVKVTRSIPHPAAAPRVIAPVSDKRGDAIGQPRKGSGTVKSIQLVHVEPSPAARTPTPDMAGSGGIKRGVRKTPLPPSAPTTPRHLEAPAEGTLSRSASMTSVESQDDRPTKRHSPMPRSPLSSSPAPGMSTPPPAPLCSPADHNVLLSSPPPPPPAAPTTTTTPTASRIPLGTRLRKMPSSLTPSARKPSAGAPLVPKSHAGEAVSAPSTIHASGIPTPRAAMPPRRTFLSSNRSPPPPMPLRELGAAPQSSIPRRTIATPSSSGGEAGAGMRGVKTPQPPPRAALKTPTAGKTPTTRNGVRAVVKGMTPPRFGLGLLGIGKAPTSTPM